MISLCSLDCSFYIRKFILIYLFFYLNVYIVLDTLKIICGVSACSLLVAYTVLSLTYEFYVFYIHGLSTKISQVFLLCFCF